MAITSGASDPEDSLGATLARMRRSMNLTGRQLAKRVGMSQPKISRLENGVGLPDPADVARIARELDAPDDVVVRLTELAEQAHNQMTDWRPMSPSLAIRQRDVADMEAEVRTLRVFQPTVIPGLLQTSDYIQAVLTPMQRLILADGAAPSAAAILEAVSARVTRQEILADPTRTFHFIITETVLSNRFLAPEYMPAQIQRLRDAAKQDNVTLGLIPADADIIVPPVHGFVLADDVSVEIDLFNTAISTQGRRDTAFYRQVFDEYERESTTDIEPILERHLEHYLDRLRGRHPGPDPA
ncbi:helix-turn-helix transcriptional regulator [Asanoa sp. NPDC049573]|uniref:helix-turn-helix domain-containing protein n=1 Tax=Asanoa sp. NPDC049573 TaxID=3155396 RepID=UPI00341F1298